MESGQGSVYENTRTGDEMVVYEHGNRWVAESNRFDAEETTKYKIMKKIKSWGYTKFIGYTDL